MRLDCGVGMKFPLLITLKHQSGKFVVVSGAPPELPQRQFKSHSCVTSSTTQFELKTEEKQDKYDSKCTVFHPPVKEQLLPRVK